MFDHILMVDVQLTDLENQVVYQGTLDSEIRIGRTVEIDLIGTDPARCFRVSKIKGWVRSTDHVIIYLIDGDGKKFLLRTAALNQRIGKVI